MIIIKEKIFSRNSLFFEYKQLWFAVSTNILVFFDKKISTKCLIIIGIQEFIIMYHITFITLSIKNKFLLF